MSIYRLVCPRYTRTAVTKLFKYVVTELDPVIVLGGVQSASCGEAVLVSLPSVSTALCSLANSSICISCSFQLLRTQTVMTLASCFLVLEMDIPDTAPRVTYLRQMTPKT